MVNNHTSVVSTLNSLNLPVYYEAKLTSGCEIPCLSYMEITNFVEIQTDVTDVATTSFQVKVWARTVKEIQTISIQLDKKMREAGWQRMSAAELTDRETALTQKILTYTKKYTEDFGGN